MKLGDGCTARGHNSLLFIFLNGSHSNFNTLKVKGYILELGELGETQFRETNIIRIFFKLTLAFHHLPQYT